MCLENGNQQLWQCRPEEWKLNKCVYNNLVRRPSSSSPGSIRPGLAPMRFRKTVDADPDQKLEKTVPDQPKGSTPVHLRTRQIMADFPVISSQGPFVPPKDGKEASS